MYAEVVIPIKRVQPSYFGHHPGLWHTDRILEFHTAMSVVIKVFCPVCHSPRLGNVCRSRNTYQTGTTFLFCSSPRSVAHRQNYRISYSDVRYYKSFSSCVPQSEVRKASQNKSEWIPVKKGMSLDSLTEIFGDVNAGDLIVKEASEELREGQLINLSKP